MKIGIMGSVSSSWTIQLAVRMQKHGHQVCLIGFADSLEGDDYLKGNRAATKDSAEKLEAEGVEVCLVKSSAKGSLRYLLASRQIAAVARAEQIDILLATYAGGFGFAALCSLFRPYAVYTVGCDVLSVSGLKRWITKRVLESASFIVSNGEHLREQTQKMVPGKEVFLSLLGVDPERFSPGERSDKPPVKIVCTRGFSEIYNNLTVIRALNLLADSLDYEMVFTSSGPLLADAEELASGNPKIQFLGGVDDKTLLEKLRCADIFISASRSDGSSISVQEAMSCGCFAVLSDIPANSEWKKSGTDNILLVPTFQVEQWAEQLKRAIEDVNLRALGGEINRQLILQRADGMKNTAELLGQLESVNRERPK